MKKGKKLGGKRKKRTNIRRKNIKRKKKILYHGKVRNEEKGEKEKIEKKGKQRKRGNTLIDSIIQI